MGNNKRIISFILAIMVVAAFGAFAQGFGDNLDKKEAVTLTGALTLNNRMFPELTANGKVYILLVPRSFSRKLKLKDGDSITVSGNIVEPNASAKHPQFDNLLGTKVLVEKATINGKEINMKDFADKDGKNPRDGKKGDL